MNKMRQILWVALVAADLTVWAGDLVIEGNLAVTSNMVSRSLSVNSATVDVLVVNSRIVLPQTEKAKGEGLARTGAVSESKAARGDKPDEGLLSAEVQENKKPSASKSAHEEWERWGDARYLCQTGGSDLAINPGRTVAGSGLSLSAIAATAFGASQHGFVASGAGATNAGRGSLQLLNLSGAQSAVMTGHGSIGMGACTVTNDQSLVAGDGLGSHGKGSVTALGFFGDGSGLTNLNLAANAGDNLVWDPIRRRLNAAAGYGDSNAVAAVLLALPGLADGDTHWSGTIDGLDPVMARTALGLGSAALSDDSAFAPADLSPYASDTVRFYDGQLHAVGQVNSEEISNLVLYVSEEVGRGLKDGLSTEGGTMAGALDMNGNPVTGLPSPTRDSDAVTKGFLRQVLSHLPQQGDLSMGAFTNGASGSYPLSFK